MKGHKGINIAVRALCDNGSQVNLITSSIVQQLMEKPKKNSTKFFGIGGNTLGSSTGEIWLKFELNDGRCMVDKFLVVKFITNYSPNCLQPEFELSQSHFADKNYNKPGKIHALFGIGIWIRIIESEIIHSRDKSAIAHKSKLGYIIFANERDPYQVQTPYIGAIAKGASIQGLMQIIHKLWEIEDIPNERNRTKEEELCEEVFINQHSRDQYGRYIVRMPFNEKIRTLGKSKRMAIRQFLAMENRMKKNPDFAMKYRIFMTEYEALGHMEPVWDQEESGYYTPHHGVLSSEKFRVVFNASAKTTSGISLNETQLVGEKLQLDLMIILMRFRQYKFGITADIEKMYRQVLIHPKDRKYQKILWREDEKKPIQTYQLKTVTYGHACAPHCAIRALIQCANDNENQFPLGAKLIRENFYVDDLLTGASNGEEANEIRFELTEILKLGGFRITKWKTNGKFDGTYEFNGAEQQSVLGLCWDLERDRLFYKLKESEDMETVWTKRKILSKLGKIYDPNGYIGPVIIKGKMIIQDLWKSNMEWDEKVKGEVKTKWEDFNNDLKSIHLISINRWLGTVKGEKMQLHGFCDASEKGYGAVVYSRIRDDLNFRSEIIISKSRVAPLKAITIPRLELCAAELLAKLMKIVIPNFMEGRNKIQIFCWSDSQIVLHWLLKPSGSLKIFVGGRIEKIQKVTENFDIKWNWIMGKDNPADLISRGVTSSELLIEKKWWNGPEWLNRMDQQWPQQPPYFSQESLDLEKINSISSEEKLIHFFGNSTNELERGKWFKFNPEKQRVFPLISAYSNWKTLINVTATVFKAAYNFENLKMGKLGNLSNQFKKLAINYLLRLDQNYSFPAEIKAATTNNRTLLAKLVLIWDNEDKLLRIDGRIRSENLTKDEQFPIVLDRNGALAVLLVRHAHSENGHAGTQLMLQYIRKKYWILGARRLAKRITKECPICFRLRMKTSQQLMSPLPSIRTNRTDKKIAFVNVGIDYAGPVTLRSHLGRAPKLEKAWIAVFVCLLTRAIHLELVHSASTKSFIEALKRFIARRGRVNIIISDNATNFVGANNYLQMIYNQMEENSQEYERRFQIKWRFTTPLAPHHGGIYEAAVKSVKYHLVRLIGDTTLTYDEYDTILCQTEAFLNSRPLMPLNDDPTSLNALTPGHFLVFEELVRIPDERDFREIPDNRLERPEIIQKMLQHLWERWQNEYLSSLINRSKWLVPQRNIAVDDLVVIKEDNLPPLKWKLGRVQEVRPGQEDHQVRTVIVRTATGVYKRPIEKLGLLIPSEVD